MLEPVLERRDRKRLGHVGVEHNLPLGEVIVDRAVDHETGGVHVGRPFEHVALGVDLDQVRGSDLVVEQAELVQEEIVVAAGHPHRDVVPDGVVVPEVGRQAVHRSEVDAGLPLFPGVTAGVDGSKVLGDDFTGLLGIGHDAPVRTVR